MPHHDIEVPNLPPRPRPTGAERPLLVLAHGGAQTRTDHVALLQHAGYEVVDQPSAEAAFADAARLQPALILARLGNASEESVNLCRRLRTDVNTRDTPLLVTLPLEDPYTRDQIVRAGATAILTEPVRRTQLLRQVGRLLARARARR